MSENREADEDFLAAVIDEAMANAVAVSDSVTITEDSLPWIGDESYRFAVVPNSAVTVCQSSVDMFFTVYEQIMGDEVRLGWSLEFDEAMEIAGLKGAK